MKTVRDKVVRHSLIGLTIRAKMIGGRRPLVPEIFSQSDRVGAKFEKAAITPKRYEMDVSYY